MGKDLKGKELGKGLIQERSGKYKARFTDKFGNRQTKRFAKLSEARQWLEDSAYLDRHNSLSAPSSISVNTWYELWIDIKKRTVRNHTLEAYERCYRLHIKPVLGSMSIQDVKVYHIQDIFNQMADTGYRNSTIRQVHMTLHGMFEYAVDGDVILSNPCKKSLKSNIGKESVIKDALTISEQKNLLIHAQDAQFENQFWFVLQTGLRTGEIVGLKWEDVSFEKKTIQIRRTMCYQSKSRQWVSGEPKSRAGKRTIPLTDEAIAILKRQKEKNRSNKVIPIEWREYVFLGDDGRPITNQRFNRCLKKVCDKASIRRISMHILRHTFATRCIEAGMKIKTLETLMGHSSIGITMDRYAHTTEDEREKEIRMVADALNVVC